MLRLHKIKGVSLIELMVALGLGLILVFSMLTFYSVSLDNAQKYHTANKEQQEIRKMIDLLGKDIENTGGFECADYTTVSANRLPRDIVSIGDNNNRQQIIFVHPVTDEVSQNSLGLLNTNNGNRAFSNAATTTINGTCGQDLSNPINIGTTIFEVDRQQANDNANFVSLSSFLTERDNDGNIKPLPNYSPTIEDATVIIPADIPYNLQIELGFSVPAREVSGVMIKNASVPDGNMDSLQNGGWINPFVDENMEMIIGKNRVTGQEKTLNQALHSNGGIGRDMNTYPLSPEAISQLRAIRFTITLRPDTPMERIFTRVVRFKNLHLMGA